MPSDTGTSFVHRIPSQKSYCWYWKSTFLRYGCTVCSIYNGFYAIVCCSCFIMFITHMSVCVCVLYTLFNTRGWSRARVCVCVFGIYLNIDNSLCTRASFPLQWPFIIWIPSKTWQTLAFQIKIITKILKILILISIWQKY